jgi:hypothetical protein
MCISARSFCYNLKKLPKRAFLLYMTIHSLHLKNGKSCMFFVKVPVSVASGNLKGKGPASQTHPPFDPTAGTISLLTGTLTDWFVLSPKGQKPLFDA